MIFVQCSYSPIIQYKTGHFRFEDPASVSYTKFLKEGLAKAAAVRDNLLPDVKSEL